MNPRAALALLAWPVLAVAVVGLVLQEAELEPAEPQISFRTSMQRSVELSWTAAAREDDFTRIGLGDALVRQAMVHAAALSGQRELVGRWLEAASRVAGNDVGAFLCPGAPTTLWATASILLREQGKTFVVADVTTENLPRVRALEASKVERLVRAFEGRPTAEPVDSALAVSALISGHLDDALEGKPPWGRTSADGGQLLTLFEVEPALARSLPAYVATVHVLAEIVHDDPGAWACGTQRR